MKNPHAVLLTVKNARADTALRTLRAARSETEHAIRQRDTKQQELQEYRVWRPKREHQLYDDIQNTEVSLDDLELLKHKVVKLRERELELVDELASLEKTCEAAKQAEQEAQIVFADSQREVEKVEELLSEWQDDENKRLEHRAEQELEEYSRPRNPAGH